MKLKYLSIFVGLAVVGAIASHGLAVKAEDNDSSLEIQKTQIEADFEAQQKQMELNREVEKKALEGASEAVKRAAEVKWEAEKKALEANREEAKKLGEDSDSESENADEDIDMDEDDDASEHRSAVSSFVRDLLNIASTTRNGGIGEEVRKVAKEQNDNKDKTAEAIDQVKSRNAFIRFLIGEDFKNLGELRSSIVTTDNHINRLNKIKETASTEVRTALDAEIKTLTQEKERLAGVVTENENKASIFGWLVKLFQ